MVEDVLQQRKEQRELPDWALPVLKKLLHLPEDEAAAQTVMEVDYGNIPGYVV